MLAGVLLILAFPDFDLWFLAWFALLPLLFAIERQKHCVHACFILGWIFGVVFFSGTCWWLTYAPITYAAFPPLLAYFLLFCVTAVAAIFPALFAAIMSLFLGRFGTWSFLLAPFVWVFTEFLRYWITGNNWNAIGYAQAVEPGMIKTASVGGVLIVGGLVVLGNGLVSFGWRIDRSSKTGRVLSYVVLALCVISLLTFFLNNSSSPQTTTPAHVGLVAIQPDVPMIGMTQEKWNEYRRNHVRLAESALATIDHQQTTSTTVAFPESPMNFQYQGDPGTQAFINSFAAKNNVSVLFNSAEPDLKNGKYYNSAVMVGPDGKEVAQYDKIYLLPFGEAVPFPFDGLLPGFVGNFSYGGEYDLFPFGDAKGGVMICFESHFGQLSREYVRNGADVIIEMTNDGYLGPTPVLRQHLANAVFRAVETNRPVLRVTNVGITAYVTPNGQVLDALPTYQEGTRVWSVAKSDGSQTFYVRYGDWFAWLCSFVTIGMLLFGLARRKSVRGPVVS